MEGHNVNVILRDPVETVSGELRRQNSEGIWVYSGWGSQAVVSFYPMHRIIKIVDAGPITR